MAVKEPSDPLDRLVSIFAAYFAAELERRLKLKNYRLGGDQRRAVKLFFLGELCESFQFLQELFISGMVLTPALQPKTIPPILSAAMTATLKDDEAVSLLRLIKGKK